MGDDVISIHQNIPNVGNSTFSAYCVKKSTWSEDEKSDISFLLQLIYVLFSRSRMNKMLLRAQETDTLTGALNTAGIIRLGNMIAEKKLLQRFTVVFFNIKQFRQINDPHMSNYPKYNYIRLLQSRQEHLTYPPPCSPHVC